MYLLKRPRYPGEPPTYAVCFDPGTIAIIGIVMKGVGFITQGIAAKRQGDFQAAILRQQAERSRQEAAAKEEDFRRNQSRALATRRAALGATGLEPASGSLLAVSEDFAGEVELQALRIRSGGELRATRAEQNALLQRFKGRAARASGFLRGGSLLVSAGGRVRKRFS